MQLTSNQFVVYRRTGDSVTPHLAEWRYRKQGLSGPYVALVRPLAWSQVYGGHCQWVADQCSAVRRKIREARLQREARRGSRGAA